jgi:hypothetical protein
LFSPACGFENSLRKISALPQDIRTAFCLLCGEQELAVSASEASNAAYSNRNPKWGLIALIAQAIEVSAVRVQVRDSAGAHAISGSTFSIAGKVAADAAQLTAAARLRRFVIGRVKYDLADK